jgi:hypothetical protein
MRFWLVSEGYNELGVVRRFSRQLLEKELLSNLFLLNNLEIEELEYLIKSEVRLKDFEIFIEKWREEGKELRNEKIL